MPDPTAVTSLSRFHRPDGAADGATKKVPSRCLGACAFSFLGGVSRSIDPQETYGFADAPDVRAPGTEPGARQSTAPVPRDRLVAYVRQMGADLRLVNKAAAATWDRRPLRLADAKALGVVFDAEQFLPWQNERDDGVAVARSSSLDGTRRAEITCAKDGGRPTFTYAIKDTDIDNWRGLAEMVARLRFAGLTVARDRVDISAVGPDIRFSMPLPPDYEKTIRRPKLDLTFKVDQFDGPRVAITGLYIDKMTSKGFARAAAALLKSCTAKR